MKGMVGERVGDILIRPLSHLPTCSSFRPRMQSSSRSRIFNPTLAGASPATDTSQTRSAEYSPF